LASPKAEATASVAPTGAAFADIELLAGTASGELMRYSGGTWTSEAKICPGSAQNPVTALFASADGRTAFVVCNRPTVAPADFDARGGFVFDLGTKRSREVSGISAVGVGPLSPDGRSIVVGERGTCEPSAPVCQTKRALLDLATGQRRELLPSDYWLSTEFRWIDLGLVYFRPECADAGCTSAANVGTFLCCSDGKGTKIAQDRLMISKGPYQVLERRRAISPGERNPVKVLDRTGTTERVLTPDSVEREFVVGLASDGRVVVWRPDSPIAPFQGAIVTYRGGSEVRTSRGTFGPFAAGGDHDVFVGADTVSNAILAYTVASDRYSRMTPPFALSALVTLPR
jgi:hypothetical protein